MNRLLVKDLEHIFKHTALFFKELQNKSIFVTGGTGFVGIWLLESLIYLNKKLKLNITVTLLSRNPDKFLQKYPHIRKFLFIHFLKGDIRTFKFINEQFSYIIHGATTSAEETFNKIDELESYEIIADGTKRLCMFAKQCKANNILLLSSGSVYGISKLKENFSENIISSFNPIDLKNASSEGKRVSEFYLSYYAQKYNIEVKIARCFSFIGPHLQLDIHYAAGNFIKNVLEKENITIKGDGSPIRSYMYISDLIIWLWTIFFKGESLRVYNIGSENNLSIKELAQKVVDISNDNITINIENNENISTNTSINYYVPSTFRAKNELGLQEFISLETAIRKTIEFERKRYEI